MELHPFDLFLIRGLAGSGKTRLSNLISRGGTFSTDQYFVTPSGEYVFDRTKLADAHQGCVDICSRGMQYGDSPIAIANTFSCRWEMQPYFELAMLYGYNVTVIDLFDGGLTDEELLERNSHGVELDTIRNMRTRWEHDWKVGNPVPPRERGDN
jgi:hypothetical protein